MELGSDDDTLNLKTFMSNSDLPNSNKVEKVKALFNKSGAAAATKNAVKEYTNKAFEVLKTLNISNDKKQVLRVFGEQLMNRRV